MSMIVTQKPEKIGNNVRLCIGIARFAILQYGSVFVAKMDDMKLFTNQDIQN